MVIKELQQIKTEKGIYHLIKGDFITDEASEIVNVLFSKKINFHEVKSLGQLERNGKKEDDTLKRINELKSAQEQANKLITKAKESGKSLRVHSTIEIELI